ncbi:MAG: class I SAM-dependent methyltransferase [Nitrososphaerota archaeon]
MYNDYEERERYRHSNLIIRRYHVKRLISVKSELERILKAYENGILLDVGCGDGSYLALLKNKYNFLIGVDISIRSLKTAKNKTKNMDSGVIEFILADARYIPIISSSADVVLCSEVLEHIEAPEKVICELFRVARCLLLITVPVLNVLRKLAKITRYANKINELEKYIGHINMNIHSWWIDIISKVANEKKICYDIRPLYLYITAEPIASIFAHVNNIPRIISVTLDIMEKILSQPLSANQMIISIFIKRK